MCWCLSIIELKNARWNIDIPINHLIYTKQVLLEGVKHEKREAGHSPSCSVQIKKTRAPLFCATLCMFKGEGYEKTTTLLMRYRERHKPNIHRLISSLWVFLCELNKSRLLVINICHVWSCSGIPSVSARSPSHTEHFERWLRVMEGRQVPNVPAVNPDLLQSTGFSLLWSSYRDDISLPVILRDRVT